MITKPSVSKYKYTLNANELSKQIATSGGREVVAVLVTGGGSSAAVRVYDSANGAAEPSPSANSFLVAANAGESTSHAPGQPALMEKGLYIELEQGGPQNGEATIFYN